MLESSPSSPRRAARYLALCLALLHFGCSDSVSDAGGADMDAATDPNAAGGDGDGDGDDSPPDANLPVTFEPGETGAPCTDVSQCDGPKPACLDRFYPLADLIEEDAGTDGEQFAALGLDFAGGYCSNAGDCASDADCGPQGQCFQPLENTTPAQFQSLVDLNLPFDIYAFESTALCLRPCTDVSQCRPGYECGVPLGAFVEAVGATETFCVPPPPPDACTEDPCVNGGTCTISGTDYECSCAGAFTGVHCELANDCLGIACDNGGRCIDGDDSYSCECAAGFEGASCETNIDDCAAAPCQNGGTCTDGIDRYSCQCAPGYTGGACETALNPCNPSPCQNGGACMDDGGGGTSCACPAGFDGGMCEINIDECAGGPCQNGGSCTDGVNGYSCACAPGYTGARCQTNIDECAANPCQHGGSCTDGIDSYSCACPAGYDGLDCENNIDECAAGPCDNGGTCIDGVDAYTCMCPPGYGGQDCEFVVNGCNPNPCLNGGGCTADQDGFTCSCAAGFTGNTCEINIDDCNPDPCLNGGTCIDGVDDFTCSCPGGFTGDNCEIDIDECAGDPCLNGGICADGTNSYSCSCAAGYDGDDCEIDIDECAGDPCLNGGVCTDGVDSYSCQCAAGYTGGNCETNIDDCAADPCDNGGVCVDGINSYSCNCMGGWTGMVCDQASILNPGMVTFSFPLSALQFPVANYDWDTLGPAECEDGINNDNADGEQDTDIDFPADAQCAQATDDSEEVAGHQPEETFELSGSIDADGNITIPMAGIAFPIDLAYSQTLGGDHISTNRFLPTHDASGTLDPVTGAMSIRLRFRMKLEGGTSAFNGPGNNCYVGTMNLPVDITLTTAGSMLGGVTTQAYAWADGSVAMTGYNAGNIPGGTCCGFACFGDGDVNANIGVPTGPDTTWLAASGSTVPVLQSPAGP